MTATAGYTRVENWIADDAAQRPASVTVLLLILARHTAGWQRDEVTLSVARIASLCGLSLQGARNAIGYALGAGLITRSPAGNHGHTYTLAKGVNSVDPPVARGSTECSPGDQLSVAQGINSVDPYIEERKGKKFKERREAAPAADEQRVDEQRVDEQRAVGQRAIGQSNGEPDRIATPQPAARTPTPPHSAAPPSPPPAPAPVQARLVDSADADPVAIYREATGVAKPNKAQRLAISQHVTGHTDLWREVCERFARNAWNVRRVDNLLDAYDKAVGERRRAEARAAEERERQRAQAPVVISEEQRAANIRKLEEARQRFALFRTAEPPRRTPGRAS